MALGKDYGHYCVLIEVQVHKMREREDDLHP
jgi:hypothetical protein